jgi:OOP family OmpA-OmpF porin
MVVTVPRYWHFLITFQEQNMKYTTYMSAMVMALVLSTTAIAGPFYVAGQVGWNSPTGDDGALDDTAVFSGAVGYKFNNLRLEGELAYRDNDYAETILGFDLEGSTEITTFLANAYYDFENSSAFTPYLGFGVGAAHGSVEASAPGAAVDESDTVFAYQLAGGVAYDLSDKFALTLDYHYLDTAEFEDIEADYSAHEVRAGVRYSF